MNDAHASQIGPIPDAARAAIRKEGAALYGQYDQVVDRESAFEKLKARTEEKLSEAGGAGRSGRAGGAGRSGGSGGSDDAATDGAGSIISGPLSDILFGKTGPRGGHHDGLVQSAAKSAARSVGSGIGRAILRGTLGSIFGGSSRSRR